MRRMCASAAGRCKRRAAPVPTSRETALALLLRTRAGMEHTVIHITDTTVFDEGEIVERFVRAKGARGQNMRKEGTAVELRLDLHKSSLPADVQERLIGLSGRHMTADGVLV